MTITSLLAACVLTAQPAVATLEMSLAARDEANDRAWATLADPASFIAKRDAFRETFRRKIGFYDIARTPLNARTVGAKAYDGFRIEKVILESAPGAYVAALVFLPDAAKFKPPYAGYVFLPGHSAAGKATLCYLQACELGARNGLAAISFDPLGQGERSQGAGLRSADEHARIGAYAALLGETTATYMLRDAVRVLDYFAGRPDIDARRLGVSGNSGGGTMASFLMVADGRVRAATPTCYLSSAREHLLACGPQDAEQNFFDELSWGFNHAALVLSAECPVLINAAIGDFFQIEGSRATYRLVRDVAKRMSLPDNWYALAESPGPHHMSRAHREKSVSFLLRHLAGVTRAVSETTTNAYVACDWTVTPTGEVSDLPGFRSVYDTLAEKFARADVSVENAARNAVPLVNRERSRVDAARVLGAIVGDDIARGRCATIHLGGKPAAGEATVALFADGTCDRVTPHRKGKVSYYERRKDDELVAVDLYLAGRSLVAVRAAELLTAAAELERRTGYKPKLVAEGRYATVAKFARAADPAAFAGVVLRNEPKPWIDSLRRREYLSFADSGAIDSGKPHAAPSVSDPAARERRHGVRDERTSREDRRELLRPRLSIAEGWMNLIYLPKDGMYESCD